jgi:hypothetical protein
VEVTTVMRAGIAIVFSALCGLAVSAQTFTVSGVVVDARTQRALPGVEITLEGHASMRTDSAGRFRLDVASGEYVLRASLVGYALVRQTVRATADAAELTIQLPEGAGGFEEHVTVTATASRERADGPASVSLYGRELQALRGVTLDDPLRALHAVPSAAATDDFYSEFAIRGSSSRHVGLVVDGLPAPYLMHSVHGVTDGGSIAMVNSDAVGGVSLRSGSFPQRIGRALGAEAVSTCAKAIVSALARASGSAAPPPRCWPKGRWPAAAGRGSCPDDAIISTCS